MNILILEDHEEKRKQIIQVVDELEIETSLTLCGSFVKFNTEINRNDFDLIVADLVVPVYDDSVEKSDITNRLIENIRDLEGRNYNTPVVAITQFNDLAENNFHDLNKFNITILTYTNDSNDWKDAFSRKIHSCIPDKTFEFIIVCALEKEANSYAEAGYSIGKVFSMHGISCRTIDINEKKGLIITPTRMGLVNSAILCSRAIDLFKPKLICMSGICAGIEGKANIYDVVIPDTCHQHDSGKWTKEGFIPEIYSVQLQHPTILKITEIIAENSFLPTLKENITLSKNEFTPDSDYLDFQVSMAPTSSGSSVVADNIRLKSIEDQHRKMTAFEMESYALYESARQSLIKPIFFSAKAVVDNGNSNKGDEFHRVACILSAKTVYEIIKRGILET